MKKPVLSFCFSVFFATNAFALGSFSDISENYMYNEAVEYMKMNGIVEGYSDGTFKPHQQINRAELLKIIIESKFSDEEIETALDDYRAKNYWYVDLTDVDIDEWYAPYVRIAVKEGIVQGYADKTFHPAQNVNFVEALKMVMKAQGISYNEDTAPWYRGLVDEAANENLIPLDITAFDLNITRGQMADLITRTDKKVKGGLNEYLVGASNVKQTYSDIADGVSQINSFINRNTENVNREDDDEENTSDTNDTIDDNEESTEDMVCGETMIDCGNLILSKETVTNGDISSLECFIKASKSCCPASITSKTTINIFGVDVTSTTYREIQGEEDDRCTLYTRFDAYEYSISDEIANQLIENGATQDDINAMLAEQEANSSEQIGINQTCHYPIDDLVEILENEKEGNFSGSTDDLAKYDCATSSEQ